MPLIWTSTYKKHGRLSYQQSRYTGYKTILLQVTVTLSAGSAPSQLLLVTVRAIPEVVTCTPSWLQNKEFTNVFFWIRTLHNSYVRLLYTQSTAKSQPPGIHRSTNSTLLSPRIISRRCTNSHHKSEGHQVIAGCTHSYTLLFVIYAAKDRHKLHKLISSGH
jgi:hypothetical protein